MMGEGCGPTFQWEGYWRGNRNLPAGSDPVISRTLGDVKLYMDPNNQFRLVKEGIPMTGSVRFEDAKAYLKIETRLNTPMDKEPPEVQAANKEIVLTPQQDGTISFVDPGGFDAEPVILKRQAKQPSSGS